MRQAVDCLVPSASATGCFHARAWLSDAWQRAATSRSRSVLAALRDPQRMSRAAVRARRHALRTRTKSGALEALGKPAVILHGPHRQRAAGTQRTSTTRDA